MKLVEGLVLLGAVVAFAWWQLRDVSKAQKESEKRRTEEAQTPAPPDPQDKEKL